jgi:hypothetical protein
MARRSASSDMVWVARVRAGDFSAIPAPFTWSHSAALAHLLDGYAIAGGPQRLSAIYRQVRARIEAGDRREISALDLWLALFYAHRGYRHQGTPPRRRERAGLNQLCENLRCALLGLRPAERAGLLAILAAMPAPREG